MTPSPVHAIVEAVRAFAHAATTRDLAALEEVLAPTAVQHVRRGETWSTLPTETYLQLMRDAKIGGEPVELEVHGVSRSGQAATVHATRTTPAARFDDLLTLVETAGAWRIVGAAVVVAPVAR